MQYDTLYLNPGSAHRVFCANKKPYCVVNTQTFVAKLSDLSYSTEIIHLTQTKYF